MNIKVKNLKEALNLDLSIDFDWAEIDNNGYVHKDYIKQLKSVDWLKIAKEREIRTIWGASDIKTKQVIMNKEQLPEINYPDFLLEAFKENPTIDTEQTYKVYNWQSKDTIGLFSIKLFLETLNSSERKKLDKETRKVIEDWAKNKLENVPEINMFESIFYNRLVLK